MNVQAAGISIRGLCIQSNESVEVHVKTKGEHALLCIQKGFLTTGTRLVQQGEYAELYRDSDYSITSEKLGEDSVRLWIVRGCSTTPTHVAVMKVVGTRMESYAHPDVSVSGLTMLGLHFTRRIPLRASLPTVLALFGYPQHGRNMRVDQDFSPTLDFCTSSIHGSAFESMVFFNKRTFGFVASKVARPLRQVHAELFLTALLNCNPGVSTTGRACTLCAESLRVMKMEAKTLDAMQRIMSKPFDKKNMLSLSFKTAEGLRKIRGIVGDKTIFWQGPSPNTFIMQRLDTLPSPRTSTPLPSSGFTHSLNDTVSALRDAAGGSMLVSAIPYVRSRPCLHGMTPSEVAVSLLFNADVEMC